MTYLPPNKSDARESAIIDAVNNGKALPIRWAAIRTCIPGHSATFLVMADALKLDVETIDAVGKQVTAKNIRANVTAKTSQILADILDCSMLTAKLADAIWDQADVHVLPCSMVQTEADTQHMSETTWMIEHSERVDKKLVSMDAAATPSMCMLDEPERTAFEDKAPADADFSVLVSTVGKHWIIEEELVHHPGMACNYGWHFSGATYGSNAYEVSVTGKSRLIQGRGTKHNPAHSDYSQTLVLVRNWCLVDGALQDLRGLLQDHELAGLANQSGAMTYLRQAGVAAP